MKKDIVNIVLAAFVGVAIALFTVRVWWAGPLERDIIYLIKEIDEIKKIKTRDDRLIEAIKLRADRLSEEWANAQKVMVVARNEVQVLKFNYQNWLKQLNLLSSEVFELQGEIQRQSQSGVVPSTLPPPSPPYRGRGRVR